MARDFIIKIQNPRDHTNKNLNGDLVPGCYIPTLRTKLMKDRSLTIEERYKMKVIRETKHQIMEVKLEVCGIIMNSQENNFTR